jgi:CBS domain-containing protein
MSVLGIMVKKPITASQDTSVKEIAKLMQENSIGSVILVKNDKPIGIVTERDLVRRVLALGKDPDSTKAFDICSKPIISICSRTPDLLDLDDAIDTMIKNKIRRLVVVDRQDKVVGILTADDIGYKLRSLSENLANKYIILMRRGETSE